MIDQLQQSNDEQAAIIAYMQGELLEMSALRKKLAAYAVARQRIICEQGADMSAKMFPELEKIIGEK